ncbi:uncharacterized protein LOC120660216 isoform X2 [Panicum virgatum]|uniref:uncharacterized protein LOC120660216 isoform X2 n=1 Tax=Panicum virgatum TaxID=38727 RepID=UPI0019D635C9|nr:uncharacterized protein LOC120660216 isoform X2 [Panicum virgatum]
MADDFTAGAGVGDRIEDVVRAEERRPKPKISTLRKSVIVLLALDNKYLKGSCASLIEKYQLHILQKMLRFDESSNKGFRSFVVFVRNEHVYAKCCPA